MSEIEKHYARTFNTASGKQVLSHLRAMTIERAVGINATDAELRWFSAQSALVRHIENLIKRGNNPT